MSGLGGLIRSPLQLPQPRRCPMERVKNEADYSLTNRSDHSAAHAHGRVFVQADSSSPLLEEPAYSTVLQYCTVCNAK